MAIGPVSNIPVDLTGADVLLLVGEDPAECAPVLDLTEWDHSYRGFHAAKIRGLTVIVAPFGSSAMEAIMWELTRQPTLKRIILAGTAGALGGYTGPTMAAVAVRLARPDHQCFDGPPRGGFGPSMILNLPEVDSVSTDRFYGCSPLSESIYPAEPSLSESWQQNRNSDAIVEMEVAAFYYFAKAFGTPDLQFGAIKVVANNVDDLASLTDSSKQAMEIAITAALAGLQS